MNDIIWNNDNIIYGGKTLYFKEWKECNLLYIKDIVNSENKLKCYDYFKEKMPNNLSLLVQYKVLQVALRRKEICYTAQNDCMFNDYEISKTSVKLFQNLIIAQEEMQPSCEEKWGRYYGIVNWPKIWKNIEVLKESKIRSFMYKQIHTVYPTRVHLFKWKIDHISNDTCIHCNEKDTYEHFFITCKKVKGFWDEISKTLSIQKNCQIKLSSKNILLLYENKDREIENFINMVISIAKFTIAQFKYGNHYNLMLLFNSNLRVRKINLQLV